MSVRIGDSRLSSWDNSRYAGLSPLRSTQALAQEKANMDDSKMWYKAAWIVTGGIALYFFMSK